MKTKEELKQITERITGIECVIDNYSNQSAEIWLQMWLLPFSMLKDLEKELDILDIWIDGSYLALHVKP